MFRRHFPGTTQVTLSWPQLKTISFPGSTIPPGTVKANRPV
jgi:hypothetical protein